MALGVAFLPNSDLQGPHSRPQRSCGVWMLRGAPLVGLLYPGSCQQEEHTSTQGGRTLGRVTGYRGRVVLLKGYTWTLQETPIWVRLEGPIQNP